MAGRFLLFLWARPLPSFSAAPGLLQLMARLQRLPWNSNAAPIYLSLSLQAVGLWGGRRRGRRAEMEWGLEREDYCWQRRNAVGLQVRTTAQSLWCKVVCVCVFPAGVRSCMLSFLLFSCLSPPEVLYCAGSQTVTVQRRTLHVQQANPGTCKGETRRNRPLSKPKAVCKYSNTV